MLFLHTDTRNTCSLVYVTYVFNNNTMLYNTRECCSNNKDNSHKRCIQNIQEKHRILNGSDRKMNIPFACEFARFHLSLGCFLHYLTISIRMCPNKSQEVVVNQVDTSGIHCVNIILMSCIR